MAKEVAKGVDSIDNVESVLKNASDASIEDLIECDGLVIGSPEYFGYMAGVIKDFFDRTYEAARGRREIFKKPYTVFISAGNDGLGALNAIERICTGYQFKKIYDPLVLKGDVSGKALDLWETTAELLVELEGGHS